MTSDELAAYIETIDRPGQSWLLAQLRLQKLQEQRQDMTPEAYTLALADIHQDLMALGEWWRGQESQVF